MAEQVKKKRKHKKKEIRLLSVLAPILLLIVIVIGLEIYVSTSGISRTIMPAPHAIFNLMVQNFARDIWPQMLFTLRVIMIGYFVAVPLGMLIAAVCSQIDLLTKAMTPLIVLLVVTPMLTLVPLLMLWMGFDENVRIIVVLLQATPIITLNTLTGFRKVETAKLELMRSLGASRLQTFVKLVFPNALPQVFTGLKLGTIFSTIAAMSADLAAGKSGLGYRIQQYSSLIMTEMAYGTILVVALIGITFFQIVLTIEKRVIVWVK